MSYILVNDGLDQEATSIRDDRVIEVPDRIAFADNGLLDVFCSVVLMSAVSLNSWIRVIKSLRCLPDLSFKALVIAIVVSTDGLVVEELVSSSEVLEEFELEVRKAKIKWITFIFLAYYSEVCAIQSTDLDEVLVFVVVLILSSEASNWICKHETCLYAHPFYIIPVRKGAWQFEEPVSWNSHLCYAVFTKESGIETSVNIISSIFLSNIHYLHLELFCINFQFLGSILLPTQLVEVLILDYYNLFDEFANLD